MKPNCAENSVRSRLKHLLIYVTAVSVWLTPTASIALSLSETDCRAIRQYETARGRSFTELFIEMTHEMEHCLPSYNRCSTSLRKRISDFDAVVRGGQDFDDDDVLAAASEGLQQIFSKSAQVSGLSTLVGDPDIFENFIWIVFVNPVVLSANRTDFVDFRIARREFFPNTLERKRVIDAFDIFWSAGAPCATLSKDHADNVIRESFIWIRTDLSPSVMRRCIAEEAFNSFGLIEPEWASSIFDIQENNDTTFSELSDLHWLLLKVLYSDELRIGQEPDEYIDSLQHSISISCDQK